MSKTPGKKFKDALMLENPLQLMGTINAYCARMAESVGYQAIYLSGGGVANASYGIPDIGETTLENVCEDVSRIASAVDVPLIVDMDTGWDNPQKSIEALIKAGAAGAHMEDQVSAKKCGHLNDKKLVSQDEMVTRIKAAVAGKKADPDFYLIARTDALANEGMESAIQRAKAYLAAGADAIFAEAFTELTQYEIFCDAIKAPVLANITEFGKTPLYTTTELKSVGVKIVLYPLSAFRAMNQAALTVYKTVREEKTQQSVIDQMQDRQTLYNFLGYDGGKAIG